jgi:hypothetical protein
MSKSTLATVGVVLVGLSLVPSVLSAQEIKGSGSNMFVPEVVETFTLTDGTTVNRMSFKGFITADDPSNPLRMASMNCTGTSVAAKDGKPIRSAGTCDSVDSDGDLAFYWWRADGTGGRWGFMGGTGKWMTVEGGGTYEPTPGWKDGRQANKWKGSWKSK